MPTMKTGADNADAAVAALDAYFPGVRVGPDRGTRLHFSLSVTGIGGGATFLDFTIGGRPLVTQVEDTAGFLFARAVRMDGDMAVKRTTVDAAHPYVVQPGLRSEYTFAHAQTLTLDASAFLARLGERINPRSVGCSFTSAAPRTPEHGSYWDAVMLTVARAVSTGVVDEPYVASGLLDLAVSASAACFPNTWDDLPVERVPLPPAAAQRARTYIDDHAHLPIMLADIAGAARMSVRGVQLAFQRAFQMSPTDYLRRVRVARARAALLSAHPEAGDSVSGIARSAGFTHPSRFAATYRAEYGENPSDTLHASRHTDRS